MTPDEAALLRAEFPPEMIGTLPRAGIQLSYVGHAAVTDRLLQVDPSWTWEPVGWYDDGTPVIRRSDNGKDAELWIKLTVCGVTRYGVGTAAAQAFDLPKQLISDAIRNAAMRFGVALDLWAKEDLHAEPAPKVASQALRSDVRRAAKAVAEDAQADLRAYWTAHNYGGVKPDSSNPITEDDAHALLAHIATLPTVDATDE